MLAFQGRGRLPYAVSARLAAIVVGVCGLASSSVAQTPEPGQTPQTSLQTPRSDVPPNGTVASDVTVVSRPERPFRRLFGTPQANLEPRLTFEGTFGGGVGGNPAEAQAGGLGGGAAGGGGTGAATGSSTVTYNWTRQRIGVNVNNVSFLDYYPNAGPNSMLWRDILSGTFYFMPTSSTRVTVSPTFKNLPEFSLADLLGTDLGQVVPLERDTGLLVDRYKRFGTTLDVSQQLSSRAKIYSTLSYGHGMIASRTWTILLVTTDFSYDVTKRIDAYGGYQFGGQTYGTNTNQFENRPRFNFGLDYKRPLSITRRTTLAFSTGTEGTYDQVDGSTTYWLVGGARLTREFGRSWSASGFYGRNVRYVEAFGEPLIADSFGAGATGLFNARTELTGTVGVSSGMRPNSSGGFDTAFGSLQLTIALTRNFALGTDYTYSRLTSAAGVLPVDFNGKVSEQTVHVYIKVWAPLVSRPRKS
jgi:hypothetical protein